jgi:hypothetical protein
VSVQRRRGQLVRIWKTRTVVDQRGNQVILSDADGPYQVVAAMIPQRSARAEVPGQAQINVMRMLVTADLDDVNLWSRVEWRGRSWDVVSPPAYHHGTRHTRHWSIDIRERP